jgi:hypothetical protein
VADDLDITFVHPTDSAQTFEADVSPEQTARECIDQLVAHRFFERQTGRTYKLTYDDGTTSKELKDEEQLGHAGVRSGSALHVLASTSGALA